MQRYAWRATYLGGGTLEEMDEQGARRSPFEAVERERLARFSLFDASDRREVVAIDCATGSVSVRGRLLQPLVRGAALPAPPGGFRHILQYKSAHADCRPGRPPIAGVIDAHHLGYRADLGEVLAELLVAVNARTGAARVQFRAALHGTGSLRPADFGLLLDGVPIAAPEVSEANGAGVALHPTHQE